MRETKIAIVADLGTLQRLPRVISRGHVAELAFTGKDITAERAKEIGLVNDVYADVDALHAGAQATAAEIAANSPLVVQGVKQVLRASDGRPVGEGLDYVAAVERRVPAVERSDGGDVRVHREAPAQVHRAVTAERLLFSACAAGRGLFVSRRLAPMKPWRASFFKGGAARFRAVKTALRRLRRP